ncbi:hypothetical protein CEXT_597541 [Caerostris extrusa]|uniref:Uncharacterized protein n=1 Tax=Caerostris extrusa TaxID=172846 RepID=A0AAV4WFF3_CAEEX|nr:hypothetical protein CEXT_597541 [Caerostris extrusa]
MQKAYRTLHATYQIQFCTHFPILQSITRNTSATFETRHHRCWRMTFSNFPSNATSAKAPTLRSNGNIELSILDSHQSSLWWQRLSRFNTRSELTIREKSRTRIRDTFPGGIGIREQ